MSDVSKISLFGQTLNIKDIQARNDISRLEPYIIDIPESGNDYKNIFEQVLSAQDVLVIPPGTYDISGLEIGDNKAVYAFDSVLKISAPITISGRAKIVGATIDANSAVDNAIIIDGTNAPGASIENCTIYNTRKSAIVIGSDDSKAGGHQWIINTRVYNNETLAACAEIYTPDVKITNCEFYYTKKAVDLHSSILFMDMCHIWSGGAAANMEQNDVGIFCNDFARLSLNNVYIDSFQHGIFNTAANTMINGNALFFYWDAERSYLNKNVNCLTVLSGSRFEITAQVAKSAEVEIMAINYSDANNYSLNSPEKMFKRFKVNQEFFPNYDPYFDIGTRDANTIPINPCKKSVENAWYIFGWLIPSTDSWVNLHIEDSNPAYYCDLSFYIDRNRTSLTTTACVNKFINADFAIGAKQLLATHSETVTAYPLLYKRTSAGTIPYEIAVHTENNQLFVPIFYMEKYENQSIDLLATIGHSS